MTGDQNDMLARLKAVLPTRWFPDTTPVLDGILSGVAYAYSWAFELLAYVKLQTRIATATDIFLDMVSSDYLGIRLPRLDNETDSHFRVRIRREILREKATRKGLVDALYDLTGQTPRLIELRRPADTGGYGSLTQPGVGGGVGYGVGGAYGSLLMHHQAFLTVYRPIGSGIPGVNGYGGTIGGYGSLRVNGVQAGSSEYVAIAEATQGVSDADIYQTITAVIPAATVIWTRIEYRKPPGGSFLDVNFFLDNSETTLS